MANSSLNIVVNEVIPIGGVITFNFNGTDITYEWVASRTGTGEVTAATTIAQTVINLEAAINADYAALFSTISFSRQLQITADTFGENFYSADSNGLNVTFTIINTSRDLTILGISGDNYLIDNPINMQVQSPYPIQRFKIKFTNLTNQNESKDVYIYPDSTNTATLDISGYIKSLFSDPNHLASTSNLNTIKIDVNFDGSFTPTSITRTFIRGGKRTVASNQTIPLNTWLQPTPLIPYWSGFPITGYYLEIVGGNRVITTKPQGTIPVEKVDFRRSNGCNQIYVKFLNMMGGYSYWLFDTFTETESGTNLGSFIKDNKLADLGNTAESKMVVVGKIPSAYISLIQDLIVSPEVYIKEPDIDAGGGRVIIGKLIRVICDKNSITENLNKRSYNVKINLLPEYRFNPSLLWSN